MRLAQPIAECGFPAAVAGTAVQPDTADQAIGLLQRNRELPRRAGCVVLLYAPDPFSPVGFGIGVGHGGNPTSDFPIVDQGNQIDDIASS